VRVRRVAILAGCAALAVVPEEHKQEGECGGTAGAKHLFDKAFRKSSWKWVD
jgi:hypothetical protein